MKKIYVFTAVFMLFVSFSFSQTTYYWVGGDDNFKLISAVENWSLSSGGPGGAGAPGASDIAVFDQNAKVRVNAGSLDIGAVNIVNNSSVVFIYIASNPNIFYKRTTGNALFIEEGSVRKDSATLEGQAIVHHFVNNVRGRIDGTFIIDATPGTTGGSYFKFPGTLGLNTGVDVYGTFRYTKNSSMLSDISQTAPKYLTFQDGSLVLLENNGVNYPKGTFKPNSTLHITGFTTNGGQNEAGFNEYGNFIYEVADQQQEILLAWQQVTFFGNVEIRNTNGQPLALCSTIGSGDRTQNIKGDLIITGNSRVAAIKRGPTESHQRLEIDGDLIINGIDFDLESTDYSVINSSSTVMVKGDIQHLSGTFRYTSNYNNNSTDIYIVELAGDSPQTIFSHNGTWAQTNTELVLKINNSSGVFLNSPLTVGRINFDTENKGVLHVSAPNYLTIRNTSALATSRAVVGASDLGYVDGPVRRYTASINTFRFPIGSGGKLKNLSITTGSTASSLYEVEYIPTAPPVTAVASPLLAVAPEYYRINTINGENSGTVTLNINGAIPGAQSHHGLVAAVFNGTAWERAGGGMLAPGNVSSGVVVTASMPALTNLYAVAYGNQSALPIHLLDFNARKLNNNTSLINWRITSESTPEKFEVLKSVNGRDFVSVEEVTSVFRQENYQITDSKLNTGTTYYRLKMYDVDGTVTLSKIVAVINGADGVLITAMMPTVVTSQARLNISSSEKLTMNLVVTDMHGRIIHRQIAGINSGNQDVILNLETLSTGTYHVTGYYNGMKTKSVRFIKQ